MGEIERIEKRNIADTCAEYSMMFGTNKNTYRVIPSMQDGLKPVQRRFLYSLYRGKGRSQFIKMAKAAADTTAQFHPHGSASVEDVGAKLASPISNNITVVDGQGNFGSYKNEKAGASRYIECKLSKYALLCFFSDFENSNVPMRMAYTGDDMEPIALPSRYPHALFNPQLSSIGYASSSNIPPYNVTEVLQATIDIIKNPKGKVFLIPDSPTGADVLDDGQFKTICETGFGTFTLRGSIEVDEISNTLTITSIPLQETIDNIMRNIVELKDKGVFDEIVEIKDYTKNSTGVRCVIRLTPTADPYKTIEKLYKKGTGLKKTYPVGIKLIDNYQEIDYNLTSFIKDWIEFRRDTVRSSYNKRLVSAMENQNINDILIFILNSTNAVDTMKIVQKSRNRKEIVERLMDKYGMNSQQAAKIADMQIHAFSREAYEKYLERKDQLIAEIKEIESILDDDNMIDRIIIDQLTEGIKLFGSPRKSKVVSDVDEEDIPDTDHIIAVSDDGYIKKLSVKKPDVNQVGQLSGPYLTLVANNRQNIFVFDSMGIASRIAVSSIPDMKRKNIGILLERFYPVSGRPITVLTEPSEKEIKKKGNDLYLILLTKLGFVKRVLFKEFMSVNGSLKAIKLPQNDELVAVEYAYDNTIKDLVIYTNKGNGIRRDINEFPILKTNARGVCQLKMDDDEYCVGFDVVDPSKEYMFYITSSGRVKITDMKYFPMMKRKEETLSLINLEKNEYLIGIKEVSKDDKIVVYRKKSEPVYLDINSLQVSTRVAKADKLIKTPRGDCVLAYEVLR